MDEIFESQEGGIREGTVIQKGFQLTGEYLEQFVDRVGALFTFWTAYPDMFLDLIKTTDTEFHFFFYQRIMLRAMMRYRNVYFTAARSTSKSFIAIIAIVLQCIFFPGTKRFIVATTKQQAAEISKGKLTEVFTHWPLLKKEVVGWQIAEAAGIIPGNYGRDYTELKFRNGSRFIVVLAKDSARGQRQNGGFIDEIRDADQDAINEVVLPMLTVSRYLPDGTINQKEPNQQRICATSAGSKATFAYEMMIDMFENAIIDPENTFVTGLDYRIPVIHGLISKDYINQLKMSASYNVDSFAREFMSYWSGTNDDSWFNYDKILIHRKLKNPHFKAKKLQDNEYYIFSYDIGRFNDMSVVCIFKVTINAAGIHRANLVNIEILGKTKERRHFTAQVIDLKRLIAEFQPREVVVDTNGVGAGVADLLIQTQIDEFGNVYPAYGFMNDDNYRDIQPRDCKKLLYGIKANGPLKSRIHSNMYVRINQGLVNFLIKEQDAKTELMATKVGQQMKIEKRVARLLPHEMTTRLIEECLNFRLKAGNNGSDITLEPINTNMHDDRYMSCAYGLWRIQEIEQEELGKYRRKGSGASRKLTFFTGCD